MKSSAQELSRRTLKLRRQTHSEPSYPFLDGKLLIVTTNRRVISDRRKNKVVKYVIRPGFSDGSNGHRVYHDAYRLIELYDVLSSECVELYNDDQNFYSKFCQYISYGYIFLHPRTDNNYSWFNKHKN